MDRGGVVSGRLVAGRYRLEDEIGSGGMGVVWRATDTQLPRTVALKQARDPGNADERRRMHREAQHAASLQHEHVVTLHDLVFDDDAHPWLVMEHVPSPSLAKLIEAGRLEPRRAASIGAQVAEALAAAHRIGLVHRDVKPGNVLFRRLQSDGARDHAMLTDFGIARRADDATHTDAGATGTAAYMSPEVADGKPATPASDVFSLGSTLYAAVFGAPPFGTDGNALMILRRVRACQIEMPPGAGSLEPVLSKLLACDPADRPTAGQAAKLLAAAAGDAAIPTAAFPTGGEERGHPRRWWLGRLVVAALLLVALVAAFRVLLPTGPSETQAADPLQASTPDPSDPSRWLRPGSDVPPQYHSLIVEAGTACPEEPAVSPALVAAMLKAESNFDPDLSDPDNDEYGIARWTPTVLQPFLPAGERSQVPVPPFPPDVSIPAVGRYLCARAPLLGAVSGEPPLLLAAAYRTSVATVQNEGIPVQWREHIGRVRQYLRDYQP